VSLDRDTGAQQLVVFTLAGECYAMPITKVQEIIRWAAPRSVASRDVGIKGVISLRGKIIPVYDLASRLGHDRGNDVDANIAIVECGDEQAGIVVDSVDEVITVSADQLEPLPVGDTETVEAIAKVGDRLIGMLSVDHITGEPKGDALPAAPELAPAVSA
jgi:purine-binding chemotaxis protein CheW